MGNGEQLTAKQFQQADGVEDWRVLAFGASAWFQASSHVAGAELVSQVAELTGNTEDLPDVDLRADGVQLRICPPDSTALTTAEVARARAISAAARKLGLATDPSVVQTVQLAIDTLDRPAMQPFWQAALGYELSGADELVDPLRRDPAIWFQQRDRPRPLRNRIHVDVSRPQPLAPDWEAAVAAAGGRERYACEWYATLADSEGNEVDLVPGGNLGDGPETADWRVVFGAMTFYPTSSPRQAAELTAAVARLADDAGLPMLVDLRPDGVTIDTGKDQWEDDRFEQLAGRIQAAARALALTADPSRLRFVQLGIDAVDIPTVRNFWRAALGYEYVSNEEITDTYDPRRLNPPLIFQQMSASEQDRRQQRNRIHVDVFVPHDQAQKRIDRALAAGGRIVYDDEAPEWWTIADPEGNEVDIAVSVGREELALRQAQGT